MGNSHQPSAPPGQREMKAVSTGSYGLFQADRSDATAAGIYPYRKPSGAQNASPSSLSSSLEEKEKEQITIWLHQFAAVADINLEIFTLILSGYFGSYPFILHRVADVLFKAFLPYSPADVRAKDAVPLDIYLQIVRMFKQYADDEINPGGTNNSNSNSSSNNSQGSLQKNELAQGEFVFRVYALGGNFVSAAQIKAVLELVYATVTNRIDELLQTMLDYFGLIARANNNNNNIINSNSSSNINNSNNKNYNNSGQISSQRPPHPRLNLIEFQKLYLKLSNKRTNILTRWIFDVLEILAEPVSPQYNNIQSIYSVANCSITSISSKYESLRLTLADSYPDLDLHIDVASLRHYFKSIAINGKVDLGPPKLWGAMSDTVGSRDAISLDNWIDATSPFLHPLLAKYVYYLFCKRYYIAWYFTEFVDFCFMFGKFTLESRIQFLCNMSHLLSTRQLTRDAGGNFCANPAFSGDANGDANGTNLPRYIASLKCLLIMLCKSRRSSDLVSRSSHQLDGTPSSRSSIASNADRHLDDVKKHLSFTSGGGGEGGGESDGFIFTISAADVEEVGISDLLNQFDAFVASKSGKEKEVSIEVLKTNFVEFLKEHERELLGLYDLSMLANCVFGVKPSLPVLENVYVSELLSRHSKICQVTTTNTFGALETVWGIIPRKWHNSWTDTMKSASSSSSFSSASSENGCVVFDDQAATTTATNDDDNDHYKDIDIDKDIDIAGGIIGNKVGGNMSPILLGPIDTSSILIDGQINQIQSSAQIALIPPTVNHALLSWYGGGPMILRKSSAMTLTSNNAAVSSLPSAPPSTPSAISPLASASIIGSDNGQTLLAMTTCEEGGVSASALMAIESKSKIDLSLLKLRFAYFDGRQVEKGEGEEISFSPICMENGVWASFSAIDNVGDSKDMDLFGYYSTSCTINELLSAFLSQRASKSDTITDEDVLLWGIPVINYDHNSEAQNKSNTFNWFRNSDEDLDDMADLTPVKSFRASAKSPEFYVDRDEGLNLYPTNKGLTLKEAGLRIAGSQCKLGRNRVADGYCLLFEIKKKDDEMYRSIVGVSTSLGIASSHLEADPSTPSAESDSANKLGVGGGVGSGSNKGNRSPRGSPRYIVDAGGMPRTKSVVKIRSNSFSNFQVQSSIHLQFNSGTIGMNNLGNSCYINSPVQAVLHLPHLRAYFLSNSYLQDINTRNRMGYQGQLADSFAKLAFDAWLQREDGAKSINPTQFRDKVGELNAQFEGRLQQDAQEFFNFLIDGLSEDLNLVEVKRPITYPDSNGRSDQELSKEWWKLELTRDTSIIQALFSGQFRSETICSNTSCNHQSVRFDKYQLISLGLPENFKKILNVQVMTKDQSRPLVVSIELDRRGVVADLLWAMLEQPNVVEHLGLDPMEVAKHSDVHNERLANANEDVYGYGNEVGSISDRDDDDDDLDFLHQFMCCLVKEKKITRLNDIFTSKLDDLIKDIENYGISSAFPDPPALCVYQLSRASCPPIFNLPIPPPEKYNFGNKTKQRTGVVRVIFSQRRQAIPEEIVFSSVKFAQSGALQNIGFPFIDVLPNTMTGEELYSFVYNKLSFAYKEDLDKISAYCTDRSALGDFAHNIFTSGAAATDEAFKPSAPPPSTPKVSLAAGLLQCSPSEDLVNGVLPRWGFTLRVIAGGSSIYSKDVSLNSYNNCVRCVWLRKCRGCVIPDGKDNAVTLRDCETVAIDFHSVVMEEFIDVEKLCIPIKTSGTNSANGVSEIGISLHQCFSDYIKEEALGEGTFCSQCKQDNTMKKAISLYKLPPILVIQFKRFKPQTYVNANQETMLRFHKIYTRVDFPLEGFDARAYLAASLNVNNSSGSSASSSSTSLPSSSSSSSSSNNINVQLSAPGGGGSDDVGDVGVAAVPDEYLYDLYGAVHHIGDFNGGHYVTVVNLSRSADSSHRHEFADEDKRWWIFNDDKVSPIEAEKVTTASAYLLFYVRRDIQNVSFEEIYEPFRSKMQEQNGEGHMSGNSSSNSSSSSTNSVSAGGGEGVSEKKSNESKMPDHGFKPFDIEEFKRSQRQARQASSSSSSSSSSRDREVGGSGPTEFAGFLTAGELLTMCVPDCCTLADLFGTSTTSSQSTTAGKKNITKVKVTTTSPSTNK